MSSSFFQWLSLSTCQVSLSSYTGLFHVLRRHFNNWCWILSSNFRTIASKTFTQTLHLLFSIISTQKNKLLFVLSNQCNRWPIWGGKVYVSNPWHIWSALIRTLCRSLSHTSQSHQQLSGLKPVHVDHISHYSHSCHVNGGGLHCCGTAGHCLRLSVLQGDVNLLNNCYECIYPWEVWCLIGQTSVLTDSQ